MNVTVSEQVTYEGFTFIPGAYDLEDSLAVRLIHNFPQKVAEVTPPSKGKPESKPMPVVEPEPEPQLENQIIDSAVTTDATASAVEPEPEPEPEPKPRRRKTAG